jgi:hypothetical protein
MHQQLWGYRDEDKLYLGVSEQKRLNPPVLDEGEKAVKKGSNEDEADIPLIQHLMMNSFCREMCLGCC